MRRSSRKKPNKQIFGDKIIMYSAIGVTILAVIVFALLMYSKSLNNDVKKGQLTSEQIASIVENKSDSESASSSIGKSIEEEEAKQNTENNINTTSVNNNLNTNKANSNITTNSNKVNTNTNVKTQNTKTTSSQVSKETKKDLAFQKPVEGEITSEFAKENLIYSKTLGEWVTHTGIDIKADKTTIVKAAEDGKVKTIKNDPRYGLTIVIEHNDGFQTVYSNLLTSEFVTEGENVKKGQSIGTVGNTAVFEVADDAHLHFEILKDSIQVDPSIYLK